MARKKKRVLPHDDTDRIKEKIRRVSQWIEYFGYEESKYAGDVFFETEASGAYIDFKLSLLILYHIYRDLGISEEVMRAILKEIDSCLEVEDVYCSVDSCLELGWYVAPFWQMTMESDYWLYDKDNEYSYDDPGVSEDGTVNEVLERFICSFRSVGYSDTIGDIVRSSEQMRNIAAREEYYDKEVVAKFFIVHSELLKYYHVYADKLSGVERRKFNSHKLVKELNTCLKESLLNLHPCTRYCEQLELQKGLYLFATGDGAYQMEIALSQLCANYMAGLNANLIDLYIFALDEEFHFLPEEYKGRSNEIFPDFVSSGKVKKKETA